MSESGIESACRKHAAKHGVPSLKISGNVAGDPDRGFLLPHNKVWLVEFKTPTGRLSPRQLVRHDELRRAGHDVSVVRSTQQFKKALALLLEALVD